MHVACNVLYCCFWQHFQHLHSTDVHSSSPYTTQLPQRRRKKRSVPPEIRKVDSGWFEGPQSSPTKTYPHFVHRPEWPIGFEDPTFFFSWGSAEAESPTSPFPADPPSETNPLQSQHLASPLQIATNHGFNHGFKVVQDVAQPKRDHLPPNL